MKEKIYSLKQYYKEQNIDGDNSMNILNSSIYTSIYMEVFGKLQTVKKYFKNLK